MVLHGCTSTHTHQSKKRWCAIPQNGPGMSWMLYLYMEMHLEMLFTVRSRVAECHKLDTPKPSDRCEISVRNQPLSIDVNLWITRQDGHDQLPAWNYCSKMSGCMPYDIVLGYSNFCLKSKATASKVQKWGVRRSGLSPTYARHLSARYNIHMHVYVPICTVHWYYSFMSANS